VVPQLRRGENSLYLWNHENCLQPVHQFVGHQDVILEFEWRKQKEGKVRKKSYSVIGHFIFTVCYQGIIGGRRSGDRMVVGFTTTCAISAYHH